MNYWKLQHWNRRCECATSVRARNPSRCIIAPSVNHNDVLYNSASITRAFAACKLLARRAFAVAGAAAVLLDLDCNGHVQRRGVNHLGIIPVLRLLLDRNMDHVGATVDVERSLDFWGRRWRSRSSRRSRRRQPTFLARTAQVRQVVRRKVGLALSVDLGVETGRV